MKKWIKKHKWTLLSLLIGTILALSCAAVVYLGTFEEIDNMLFDEMTRKLDRYTESDAPITIIAIDEKTIEKLGTVESWSRQISANLIFKLNQEEEKPVIIGIDLPYREDKDMEGDKAFVKACELGENVCLAVSNIEGKVQLPYTAIRNHVVMGSCSGVEAGREEIIREFLPKMDTVGMAMDTFPVVLYKAYQDHAGKEYHLKDIGMLPVRFNYSRAASGYETYSFIDVLYGKVNSEVFANKIVIVGDYTQESRHHVPNSRGGQMPDAALQANIIEALLARKIVYKLPNEVVAVIYGCLIFGCYCYIFLIKAKKSIPGLCLYC